MKSFKDIEYDSWLLLNAVSWLLVAVALVVFGPICWDIFTR